MPDSAPIATLDPNKFQDPLLTARGERRAQVEFDALRTLWFNTGTLCNLTCRNCYIESSPRNDRLAYISAAEVEAYLDEIARDRLPTVEIGFTGGEPFMNPQIASMLETTLRRGFRALVLTNAMRPMRKLERPLLDMRDRYGDLLVLRVSLDHHAQALHETERGARTWKPTIAGLQWLARNGFALNVAGRTCWGETESDARRGYQTLFDQIDVRLDASDPVSLVLFPEMDGRADVPEITVDCWGILGISPASIMCASSRMVVKRKDAERPSVLACTLVPYDERFEMGTSLAEAAKEVSLNHPHCARFCVLGGGSCSK